MSVSLSKVNVLDIVFIITFIKFCLNIFYNFRLYLTLYHSSNY